MSLYAITNGTSGTVNAYSADAALVALGKLDALSGRRPSKVFNEFCAYCDEVIGVIDELYASGSRVDASAAKRHIDVNGKPVRRKPGFSPHEIARAFAKFNAAGRA